MHFLAAGAVALVLAFSTPRPAAAQWYGYGYPAYSYYYGYPGAYYTPPYYWTGNYYVNPWTSGWYYQQYSPWTNQYYYRYRVYPTYRGWWY
jgi:hypothetical protein